MSTDMVVRLHDQNAGKTIPTYFNRDYSSRNLRRLELPQRNRLVDLLSGAPSCSPIEPVKVMGGQRWIPDRLLRHCVPIPVIGSGRGCYPGTIRTWRLLFEYPKAQQHSR